MDRHIQTDIQVMGSRNGADGVFLRNGALSGSVCYRRLRASDAEPVILYFWGERETRYMYSTVCIYACM